MEVKLILKMCKCPMDTKHFNKGQKLWRIIMTGQLAAKVVGKFRGKGRYVAAWIRWDRKNDIPVVWKDIEVNEAFYERIDKF